jgi:transcriptional regulator with XRE-family HTH domain
VILASKNIRYLLEKTHISARELDKILGKIKGSVSGYSNREDKAPPIEVTISICKHFNISVDDFLFKDLAMSENILDTNPNNLASEPPANYERKNNNEDDVRKEHKKEALPSDVEVLKKAVELLQVEMWKLKAEVEDIKKNK